jgi:hypothetical protein
MQFPLGKLQLLEVSLWRFCVEFGTAQKWVRKIETVVNL